MNRSHLHLDFADVGWAIVVHTIVVAPVEAVEQPLGVLDLIQEILVTLGALTALFERQRSGPAPASRRRRFEATGCANRNGDAGEDDSGVGAAAAFPTLP